MASEIASKTWTKTLLSKSLDYLKGQIKGYSDYRNKLEIVVGCWTNGKPIYRQFFNQPKISLTAGSWVDSAVKHADYDMEEIIHGESIRVSSTMTTHLEDLTFVITTGNVYVRILRGGNTITFDGGELILFYTKKTDAENSFTPDMITSTKVDYFADNFSLLPNDYSTNEIVVGCWMDGKPIYRKVFQGITPGNTTNTTTSVQVCPVLDNLVSFDYIMKDSSNYRFTGAANVGNGEIYSAWLTDLHYIRHRASGSAFFNRPVVWIAEYTKTTDAPNSYSIDMLLEQYNIKHDIDNLDETCTDGDVAEVLG